MYGRLYKISKRGRKKGGKKNGLYIDRSCREVGTEGRKMWWKWCSVSLKGLGLVWVCASVDMGDGLVSETYPGSKGGSELRRISRHYESDNGFIVVPYLWHFSLRGNIKTRFFMFLASSSAVWRWHSVRNGFQISIIKLTSTELIWVLLGGVAREVKWFGGWG